MSVFQAVLDIKQIVHPGDSRDKSDDSSGTDGD